jgi:hypothetical protein
VLFEGLFSRALPRQLEGGEKEMLLIAWVGLARIYRAHPFYEAPDIAPASRLK